MAKRGRKLSSDSLDALVAELRDLDNRRRDVVTRLRKATDSLLAGGESLFPLEKTGNGRRARQSATKTTTATPGRKKGYKLAPEVRAKMAEAAKKRWAEKKAAQKPA